MMTQRQAQAAGQKCLSKIKAKGCTLNVFENLGWHYTVHGPGFSVHGAYGSDKPNYWALPSPSYSFWCPERHSFTDPNKAIACVIAKMRETADELHGITRKAEKAVA